MSVSKLWPGLVDRMTDRFDEATRLKNLLGRREAIIDWEKDTRTVNHDLTERLVSYPSPEGEGLSAALSRSVSESEICPDLQASLHAATICRGPSLAGTLASDLPKTASNRVSTAPFRARVWQSHTGSASSGLPRGCLRCPSTIQEMDLTY